jgi:ABC-type antimicrobial peptide transport system permease subunit
MKVRVIDALSEFSSTRLSGSPLLICSLDATEIFCELSLSIFIYILCTILKNSFVLGSDQHASSMLADLTGHFLSNLEQASRFKAGGVKYSVAWLNNNMVYQKKAEGFVISILLNDDGNLGVIDEEVNFLATILQPLLLS